MKNLRYEAAKKRWEMSWVEKLVKLDSEYFRNRISQRKLIKKKYGKLFDDMVLQINKFDPMLICEDGDTAGYAYEVQVILAQLRKNCTLEDVERIVYKEFCGCFGVDENDPFTIENVGPREKYAPIAAKVFAMWGEYNAK